MKASLPKAKTATGKTNQNRAAFEGGPQVREDREMELYEYKVKIYSITGERKQSAWGFGSKSAASRFANQSLETRKKAGAVILDSIPGFHIIMWMGEKWAIKVVEA